MNHNGPRTATLKHKRTLKMIKRNASFGGVLNHLLQQFVGCLQEIIVLLRQRDEFNQFMAGASAHNLSTHDLLCWRSDNVQFRMLTTLTLPHCFLECMCVHESFYCQLM